MKAIFNALKGIGGEFEVQRVLGALGTVTYIACAPAFVALGVIKASFEAFCIGYPAGLAACIGATAGAIALKDRNVAAAKATEAGTRATNAETATATADANQRRAAAEPA